MTARRGPSRTSGAARAWPALVVAAALGLAGCTTGASAQGPATGSSTSSATSSPEAPATSSPSTAAASPTAPPAPEGPEMLRQKDSGPKVLQVQQRLSDLGYWLGSPDGTYGALTQQAVMALQGAAGLDRDGVVGPLTRQALETGTLPDVSTPTGHAVEIDRDAGLVVVADDGRPTRVLHTSTGTFERYTSGGQSHVAATPAGTFDVYREVDGWDDGPLGELYRPRYFQTDGVAVHGYADVPAYPASHGCARVSLAAMDMLWADDLMPIGATVVVR